MSDNSENEVDNKQKSKNKTLSNPDIKKFIKTILLLIFGILIYFILGGYILYACKVAQSNILPIDINCSPYTDGTISLQEIYINIFNTIGHDPPLSEKIKFPFNEKNQLNSVIDMLNGFKNAYNASSITAYFISIIETLISFNYTIFNTFFNMLNNIPEFLILIMGPFCVPFLITILSIVNFMYICILWFLKFSWLFKKNTNTNPNNSPTWSPISILDIGGYGMSFGIAYMFLIFFWILLLLTPTFPLLSILTVFWCLFSMFGYSSIMNSKSTNVHKVLINLLKYYKVTLVSIISLIIIITSFMQLGNIFGIFSLLIVLLIYFNIIPINLFSQIVPEHFSLLESYTQAKKSCSYKTPITSIFDFFK